ncbi:hypothetical protein [Psychrobium sp. 1_MG-2023]|uniref:hypothetical protein n=1 Tax=Psychrobium sp. 1_MG-2023 TaxID=3062624 RepID=UPI000C33272B|nr:hypothetical protein [Psychrobium sp. 1_MG-2023]MDP2562445.1 hypothetical protein [Psychrobium sp. 1_MG-2023]PKF56171.1 hypothetical protein CW748_10975 [Alteromonadales bacterium alter-6D02]
MNNKQLYKKPEMIVALSALLISVITAVIGVYSAYIDRAYARASVWPRLEVFQSFDTDSIEYGVTNNGTGPAIIKHAIVRYNNEVIHQWRDIPDLPQFVQSHIGQRILPSKLSITPIVIEDNEVSKLQKVWRLIEIELCYCSIYDECWQTDKTNQPTLVEACIVSKSDRFLQ